MRPTASKSPASPQKKIYQYPDASVGNLMEKLTVVFQEILKPSTVHKTIADFKILTAEIITGSDLDETLKAKLTTIFSKSDSYPAAREGKKEGHENIRKLGAEVTEAEAMSTYYPFFGLLFQDDESISGRRTGQSHFSSLTGIRLQAALAIIDVLKETNLFTLKTLKTFLFDTNLTAAYQHEGGGFSANQTAFRSSAKAEEITQFLSRAAIKPVAKLAMPASAAAAVNSVELRDDEFPSALKNIREFMDHFSDSNHQISSKLAGGNLGKDFVDFIRLRIGEVSLSDKDEGDLITLEQNMNDGVLSDPNLLTNPRTLFNHITLASLDSEQRKSLKTLKVKIESINKELERDQLPRESARIIQSEPQPQIVAPVKQRQPQPQAAPPSKPLPRPEVQPSLAAAKPITPPKKLPREELKEEISAEEIPAAEMAQLPEIKIEPAPIKRAEKPKPAVIEKPSAIALVKNPEIEKKLKELKAAVQDIEKVHFKIADKFIKDFEKPKPNKPGAKSTAIEEDKIGAEMSKAESSAKVMFANPQAKILELRDMNPDAETAKEIQAQARMIQKKEAQWLLLAKPFEVALTNAAKKSGNYKSRQEAAALELQKKADAAKAQAEWEAKRLAEQKAEALAKEMQKIQEKEERLAAAKLAKEDIAKSLIHYRKLGPLVINLATALYQFKQDYNSTNGANISVIGMQDHESYLELHSIKHRITTALSAQFNPDFAVIVDQELTKITTETFKFRAIYDFNHSEINIDPALIHSFQNFINALSDIATAYKESGKTLSEHEEDLSGDIEKTVDEARRKFPAAEVFAAEAAAIRQARATLLKVAQNFATWINAAGLPTIDNVSHLINLFCRDAILLRESEDQQSIQGEDGKESLRSLLFHSAVELQRYMGSKEGKEFFGAAIDSEEAQEFLHFDCLTFPSHKISHAPIARVSNLSWIASYRSGFSQLASADGSLANFATLLNSLRTSFTTINAELIDQYSSNYADKIARDFRQKTQIFPNSSYLSLRDSMKVIEDLMRIKSSADNLLFTAKNVKSTDCAHLIETLCDERESQSFNFKKAITSLAVNRDALSQEYYNRTIASLHLAMNEFSFVNKQAYDLTGREEENIDHNRMVIEQINAAADLALAAFTQLAVNRIHNAGHEEQMEAAEFVKQTSKKMFSHEASAAAASPAASLAEEIREQLPESLASIDNQPSAASPSQPTAVGLKTKNQENVLG